MKKTSTKSAADKADKEATPAKPAPSPVKKTTTAAKRKTTKAAPAVNDDAISAAPPVVKETTSVPLATTILAQIDVGFGNTLYIRGEGPGLSWEIGTPLDCVADDKWSISLAETAKPVVFKFLINDQNWCVGEDYIAQPGTTVALTPTF